MNGALNPYASPQADLTPPRQWAAERPDALRRVKAGLSLIYYGICCALALFTLGLLPLAAVLANESPTALVALVGLPVGTLGAAIVAALVIGQIFCLRVPREARARGFLLGAIIAQIMTVVYVASHVALSLQWMVTPSTVSLLFAALFPLGGLASFAWFQRRLAFYLGQRDLVSHSTQDFLWGGATLLALVLAAVSQGNEGRLFGGLRVDPWLLFLLFAVGVVATLVRCANLVTYLRGAITLLPSAVQSSPPTVQ